MNNTNCPHCNETQDTSYWFECGGHDGACFDIKCLRCKEQFEVSAGLVWHYNVVPEEILDDE